MTAERGSLQYQPFDNDVAATGAYRYTTGKVYSARVANARMMDLTLSALDLRHQRVLDVGCGDGTYTIELFERGRPDSIHGIDLSEEAVALAASRSPDPAVTFSRCNGSELAFEDNAFDVAHLRGVLHHMQDPAKGVAEALRVAPRVFIIEPNGWSPLLKVIEKVSKYHREHGERSFSSWQIEQWCRAKGARIVWKRWAGLVPFFCPEPIARCIKVIEPIVEALPGVRQLGCAVFAATVERPVGADRSAQSS